MSRTPRKRPASAADPSGPPAAKRRRRPAAARPTRTEAAANANDVRTAIEKAFEGIGGVARLTAWAEANDTQFYRLWSRLTPVRVTGGDGGELLIQIVRHGDHPPAE